MIKVVNMTSPRSGRPVPNQFIITVDYTIYFKSYKSIICKLERNKNGKFIPTFGPDWNRSVTTTKYLYKFLKMYDVKHNGKKDILSKIANNEFHYNAFLGEKNM